MSDYMHLIGADEVSRAGHTMTNAADSMRSAAAVIDTALERHRAVMDDWLQRLEEILERDRKERREP